MNTTNSPTFCPAPWTALQLSHNGDVKACSYSPAIGNSNSNTMDEIVRGPLLKSMRETMQNGQWHKNCHYCKSAEDTAIGGRSERQNMLQWFPAELKKQIDENIDTFRLIDCGINWSNLCNLSCNYCNADTSTTWQTSFSKPFNLISLPDDTKNWLVNNSDHLRSIMLGGGEPLLQKRVNDLLLAIKKNVNINITTNLSVNLETNPMFNTILKNKNLSVTWYISFDGIEDKFEYVRDGATWEVFIKNIDILKKHNQTIIAHPAYGLYCALDLEEYIDFCVDNNLFLFFCDIFDPKELDIRYAPKSVRELAIQNIDTVLLKYQGNSTLSLDTLLHYKNMAKNGMHYSGVADNDKFRSNKILSFNQYIEHNLNKKKTFAELWPRIQKLLLMEIE